MFKKLKQLSGYQWFLIIFCVVIASLSLNALIGIKRLEHGGSRSHPVSTCELRGHNLTYHAQSTPTCTSTGYYSTSCYECTVCGLFFSDSTGENRISSPYVRHTPGHIPVCIAESLGVSDYSEDWEVITECSVCGEVFLSKTYNCDFRPTSDGLFEEDFTLIAFVAGKVSFADCEYASWFDSDNYLIMSYFSLSSSFMVPVVEPYSINDFEVGDVLHLSGYFVNDGADCFTFGYSSDVVIEKLGFSSEFVELLASADYTDAVCHEELPTVSGGLCYIACPYLWTCSCDDLLQFNFCEYYSEGGADEWEGVSLYLLESDLLKYCPTLYNGSTFYGENVSSTPVSPYVDLLGFWVSYPVDYDYAIFKVVSFGESQK